jgi:anti-sigma regulatory factor (Ser/Thr protein kinase)
MADRDSKSVRVTIGCNGATAVAVLTEAARRFSEDNGLVPTQAARLAILVEELVINALEHGGVADDQRIDLTLADETGGLILTLSDPGTPYDPRSHVRPDTVPERGGGAGLDLVLQWAEILDYRRKADRNELRLRLRAG